MTALGRLRIVALLEGVSFLVLLFIAMPLKYLAGRPLAVEVVGLAHGLLFLLFLGALYRAVRERGWPFRRWLIAFVSSLLPFGTLVFDRSLRSEMEAVSRSEARSSDQRAPRGAPANTPPGRRSES